MYREHGATGRRRGEQDLEIGAPAEVHAALGRITRDTLDQVCPPQRLFGPSEAVSQVLTASRAYVDFLVIGCLNGN